MVVTQNCKYVATWESRVNNPILLRVKQANEVNLELPG